MQEFLFCDTIFALVYPVSVLKDMTAVKVIIVRLYPHAYSNSLVRSNIKNSKSKNDKV